MRTCKNLVMLTLVLAFAAPVFADLAATPAIPATPAKPAVPGIAPATPAQSATPAIPAARSRPAAPGIGQRIHEQERRIEQGERSGALTGKETTRLERKEQKIKKMEAKMKAGGKVTPQERRKMDHQLDQQSKRIHREKYDRQHR